MSILSRLRSGRFLVKLLLFSALLALLTCVVGLQIDNYFFKRRAEDLLADFGKLRIVEGTYADAKPFLTKWEWLTGKVEGCDQGECHIYFSLDDFGLRHFGPQVAKISGSHAPIWRLALLLGERPGLVRGWITIRRGRIVSWASEVWVVSVPDDGTERFLVGNVAVEEWDDRYERGWPRHPDLVMPQMVLHGQYVIGSQTFHPNADTGGGIDAPMVWVQFTPYANPTDIERLSRFNLNCFTGWHVCNNPNELLPSAADQYKRDSATLQATLATHACAPQDLEDMGRNAQNIVTAKLTGLIEGSENTDSQTATFQLVDRLKRGSFWKPEQERSTATFSWAVYKADHSKPDLRVGSPYVLMFNRWSAHGHEVWLYPCGLAPYSDDNLKLIQRGIQADTRSQRIP